MQQRHLLGRWQAQMEGQASAWTLQLQPHPELRESVRGQVQRTGATALLSGDVDAGQLTLEESLDGKRISATWVGEVAGLDAVALPAALQAYDCRYHRLALKGLRADGRT